MAGWLRKRVSAWAGARTVWTLAFATFLTLMSAWALATPITAPPDEAAHMVKAAAVVRGGLGGEQRITETHHVGVNVSVGYTAVRVPAGYRDLDVTNGAYRCFRNDDKLSVACRGTVATSGDTAMVLTSAGTYGPGYYLLVGWPSLWLTGEAGLYAMRLMSALLCAALLASAVVAVHEGATGGYSGRIALTGVLTAATPTTVYFGAVVNPNGPEIAAAVLAWAVVVRLATDRDGLPHLRRRLVRLGAACVLLASMRALGPLWIALILAAGLLLARPGRLRRLARLRPVWLCLAVTGAAGLAAVVWTLTADTLALPDETLSRYAPLASALKAVFDLLPSYLHQMIAIFGSLNVDAPELTYVLWWVMTGCLVVLSLAVGRRREILVLAALMAGSAFGPMALMAPQAAHLGLIWQGRYLLAVAVGVPVLAAVVLGDRWNALPERLRTRVPRLLTGCWALAQAGAFCWAALRYAFGRSRQFSGGALEWGPPVVGWPTALCLLLLSCFFLLLLAVKSGEGEGAAGDSPAGTVLRADAREETSGTESNGTESMRPEAREPEPSHG
ncbi:DUF2142 domain-containing protein [Streptomyces sp. H10-C2]|uniref:DUF2142 domain-containing protein n=1 Tax=unclassified Streptomyces TaxID=2593676 RepID=UPI0024BA2AFF|nr:MULTISPECIES: DUF2142 domain-containing protein [unclassified Streptomyces]MDJ0342897.1 DUF2142 domain-containing protein [Streptomyces sp. PH10-H1]MDJ0372670.1 DUF2142 domain-containing protein [Streptomyces sp. H10-C2]